MARDVLEYRLDKTAFSVIDLKDEGDDRAFWFAKTPDERLEAAELLRQSVYGYDPATARLQRVFAVAELERR